ncbi:hypothetical protein MKW98_020917 [Papaver atlanticum]|uniref:FBD domain-containing protein n=1 Tax=Papaver atlanticum TaxID=357466 RepID=A0AAD4TFW5_9MAGN|nr:hypothetical protein MKW98_020917 [Papaver atlanticum]
MEEAVQTCVLSTRWRYIWTSLSVLKFGGQFYNPGSDDDGDDDDDRQVNRCIRFIDKVLSLHDNSDIQTFDLGCVSYYLNGNIEFYKCIDRWIATAASHNLQEFYIEAFHYGDFEIPLCLCTCKSLKKLVLDVSSSENYKGDIIIPNTMSLPQLKSLCLSLDQSSFIDEKLINGFFSSFPSLESLIMHMGHLGFGDINLLMSFPKLRHFRFHSWNHEKNTEVELNAPSLLSFSFEGYLSTNITLTNLSSLVTVDIKIHVKEEEEVPGTFDIRGEKKEIYAQRMMGLLRGIRNVKILMLNRSFLKFNYDKPPVYPFCDEVKINPEDIGDYWDAGLSLPCMICHLKSVEIKGLRGYVNELKFLEILLKHARVLEKVVLTSTTRQDSQREKRMTEFREFLQMFPKASKSVILLFNFFSKVTLPKFFLNLKVDR